MDYRRRLSIPPTWPVKRKEFMTLGNIYHISMIAVGVYGVVLSTIVDIHTVRKHKKTATGEVVRKKKTGKFNPRTKAKKK